MISDQTYFHLDVRCHLLTKCTITANSFLQYVHREAEQSHLVQQALLPSWKQLYLSQVIQP